MPGIFIGNAIGNRRGGGAVALDGNPSALILTVLSDTSIKLDWTIGSTNQDGHSIERSTDGVNYTEIGTVLGTTDEFINNTGLTTGTLYYYRVRAYKADLYSPYTSEVSARTYHAEIVEYIDGLATPLSSGQKDILNDVVNSLLVNLEIDSLSDYFDTMYILAGETQESSLKNLVKDAHHATAVSSPTFTALEGFLGNGSSSYINTNYNPSTQGVNCAQDSFAMGGYSRTDGDTVNTFMGGYDAADYSFFRPRYGGSLVGHLNSDGNGYISSAVADSLGMFIMTRGGGLTADVIAYKNRATHTAKAGTGTMLSTGLVNANVYLLARNGNGTANAFNGTHQIAFAFTSKHVDTTDRDIIIDAFEDYMMANGKSVNSDYFSDSLAGYGMNSSNNFPAQYYNGKTYVSYQGDDDDAYIVSYTHSTGVWANPVKLGTNPLSNGDAHGAPAIFIDSAGYIHALFGAHNTDFQYVKSTNVEDITAWTSMTSPAAGTYPHMTQFSNGDLYLFYRAGHWAYRKSTNGGTSWGSAVVILHDDGGSGDGFAVGVFRKGAGDVVHCVANIGTSDANKRNVYYLKFDGTNWKNIGGDTLTLPMTTANNSTILAYNTGVDWSVLPTFALDSNDKPLIVFPMGHAADPTVGGAGVFPYKFLKHNGTAWVVYDMGVVGDRHSDVAGGVVRNSDTNIDVYLTAGGTAGAYGGNVLKYNSLDGGQTWEYVETIIAGQYLEPTLVRNGIAESILAFSEYSTSHIIWNFKGYVWGSGGFVRKFR